MRKKTSKSLVRSHRTKFPECVVFKFNLGVRVRDRVTGRVGIVTSRIQYLNGCLQYGIVLKKNKFEFETEFIDQGQLDPVKGGGVVSSNTSSGGGPQATRSSAP